MRILARSILGTDLSITPVYFGVRLLVLAICSAKSMASYCAKRILVAFKIANIRCTTSRMFNNVLILQLCHHTTAFSSTLTLRFPVNICCISAFFSCFKARRLSFSLSISWSAVVRMVAIFCCSLISGIEK